MFNIESEVLVWLHEAIYDIQCQEGKELETVLGGTKMVASDPNSYMNTSQQLQTWWKNNIERNKKRASLLKDAEYFGNAVGKSKRALYCRLVTTIALDSKEYFQGRTGNQNMTMVLPCKVPSRCYTTGDGTDLLQVQMLTNPSKLGAAQAMHHRMDRSLALDIIDCDNISLSSMSDSEDLDDTSRDAMLSSLSSNSLNTSFDNQSFVVSAVQGTDCFTSVAMIDGSDFTVGGMSTAATLNTTFDSDEFLEFSDLKNEYENFDFDDEIIQFSKWNGVEQLSPEPGRFNTKMFDQPFLE